MTQFLKHCQLIAPSSKGVFTNIDCEYLTFNERMANEGLTLETLAAETLYSGQFTLSTQCITPNYLVLPH